MPHGALTLGALAGEIRPVRGPGGPRGVTGIGGLDGAPLQAPAGPEEHAAAAGAGTSAAPPTRAGTTSRCRPRRTTGTSEPDLEAECLSWLRHEGSPSGPEGAGRPGRRPWRPPRARRARQEPGG